MNIKTIAIILSFTCISYLQGKVTEKLAANSAKIETLKKEIKTDAFEIHNKKCTQTYCRGCKLCTRICTLK
jgi:ferredoxin